MREAAHLLADLLARSPARLLVQPDHGPARLLVDVLVLLDLLVDLLVDLLAGLDVLANLIEDLVTREAADGTDGWLADSVNKYAKAVI